MLDPTRRAGALQTRAKLIMQNDDSRSVVMMEDDDHVKRVRKFALILLLVLVIGVVSTILLGGPEYLHLTAWLLLPGGLGTLWVFRRNSATDSGANRPPVPIQIGHLFRTNSATLKWGV